MGHRARTLSRMAILGLIIAVLAIAVSIRAAVIAEQSAHAEIKAIALSLSTDVEVTEFHHDDSTKRWKFNPLGVVEPPEGSLPGHAEPGEEYTIPASENMLVTVMAAIQIENLGPRRATVTFGSVRLVEFLQDTTINFTTFTNRRSIPECKVDIDRGENRTFFVFAGQTVGTWFQSGATPGPKRFEVPISATAGPDGVTQNWNLTIEATIFDPVSGNASGVRVLASVAPRVRLLPLPRTFPDWPASAYFRKFFFGSRSHNRR